MNLEGKINVIKTAKDNIKSAIIAKGVVPSGNISTYASAISEIDTTNNTNLTINPSTTVQTFTVSGQYTGYETVKVNGVTASIDSDIKASNIKSGVNILGVTGNVVELQGEVKTETLNSVNGNTYVPSSGANGITSIKVNPKNMDLTITPSTTEVVRTVPSGYSGHGNVKVEAVDASIDSNITAGNIKQGVSILGIIGDFKGEEATGIISNINNENYIVRTNGDIELISNNGYTIDLHAISVDKDFSNAYKLSTTIYKVSLGAITYLTTSEVMVNMFRDNSEIVEVNFRNLKSLGESHTWAQLGRFCYNCPKLRIVNFDNLESIQGDMALKEAFYNTTISTLYFPSLKSTSFGYRQTQFNNMLSGVTGCTVHFPSNLQSVIGSWSDVQNGFGGTNTVVAFDLPATT